MCDEAWYGSTPKENEQNGQYANYFKVGHNAFEFVLDFGHCYLESGDVELHTRIITNPAFANTIFEVLRKSLEQYEQAYEHIVTQ